MGERIVGVRVRNPALREPVDRRRLGRSVRGRDIEALRRRAKYLLIDLEGGAHPGGAPGHERPADPGRRRRAGPAARARRLPAGRRPPAGVSRPAPLRAGPRPAERRGWRRIATSPPSGIEPLSAELSGEALAGARPGPPRTGQELPDGRPPGRRRRQHLRQRGAVPGGDPPAAARWRGSRVPSWQRLAAAVRATLEQAIAEGGTTLNDFADGEGRSRLLPGLAATSTAARARPAGGAAARSAGSSWAGAARSTARAASGDRR